VAKNTEKSKGLIIWDYNGTLLDDGILTTMAALKEWSLYKDGFHFNDIRNAQDVPSNRIPHNLDIDLEDFSFEFQELARAHFMDIYKTGLEDTPLRSGVTDVLEYFKKESWEQATVSNHPTDDLKEELAQKDIADFFNIISGRKTRGEIYHKATKPDRALKIVKDYIQEERGDLNFIIIGDSVEEPAIAHMINQKLGLEHQFKMKSIGLYDGLFSRERIETCEHPYDVIVEHPADILQLPSQYF
jgi:phosphoglycolate phosphatase-like HAD superfamily hydrolase